MNTTAWLAQELRASGRTTFDFFSECWIVVNATPPGNQVVIASQRYNQTKHLPQPVIPWFICRRYEMIRRANATLPAQAVHMPDLYHKTQRHEDGLRLVSDGPVLMARKCRDGVWRC